MAFVMRAASSARPEEARHATTGSSPRGLHPRGLRRHAATTVSGPATPPRTPTVAATRESSASPACLAVGLAGYRLGHVMRTSRILAELHRRGHRIVVYTAGTPARYLRETQPELCVHELPALRYVQAQGRVSYAASAAVNLPVLARAPATLRALSASLVAEGARAVLVDFEPFLPRAARRLGLPYVSLNHPDVLLAARRPDQPSRWITFLVVRTLIRLYNARPDLHLVSSFYDAPLPPGSRRVGPIYREAVLAAQGRVEDQGFVLVYADPRTETLLARAFGGSELRFRIYSDRPAPAAVPRNFEYLRPGLGFVDDLRRCRAVVSNSGHQTMSEALLLGKPLLAVPQAWQYEEHLNALHLERSGGGAVARHAELHAALPRLLARLDEYRDASRRWRPQDGFSVEDGAGDVLSALREFLAARGLSPGP